MRGSTRTALVATDFARLLTERLYVHCEIAKRGRGCRSERGLSRLSKDGGYGAIRR